MRDLAGIIRDAGYFTGQLPILAADDYGSFIVAERKAIDAKQTTIPKARAKQ